MDYCASFAPLKIIIFLGSKFSRPIEIYSSPLESWFFVNLKNFLYGIRKNQIWTPKFSPKISRTPFRGLQNILNLSLEALLAVCWWPLSLFRSQLLVWNGLLDGCNDKNNIFRIFIIAPLSKIAKKVAITANLEQNSRWRIFLQRL